MTELVSNGEVMELSQAFSTSRDAITTSSKFGPVNFYWNFLTNEQFETLTAIVNQQPVPQCLRQVIGPLAETSVLQPNTLIIKPSVLLGFDERNQVNSLWGIRYVGDGVLRGIPTNMFQSCFYVNDIKATVAATYHVSDVTKFQAYLRGNTSIILQLDVKIKNERGRQDAYSYNVFRYTPNPSRREERQALETPAGVYCLNRTSTLAVPADIPDRVSNNAEAFSPNFNSSIFSSHILYDTELQFTRFDAWFADPQGGPAWLHFTEMHDFATGLSYRYNNRNRQCTVQNITQGLNDAVTTDDNPNLLQMGDPQHLFLMDDIDFQYTGEKRCRDRVWCHVWIGEKIMPNNTVQHREWYWASTFNDEPLQQWIPMKLVLKQYVSGVLMNTFEMSIFNYRHHPMTIFEIDFTLADCYRALGPSEKFNIGVLSFKIVNDKNYPVYQNLNFLRLHILETLVFTMHVRPIRISHIIVDQNDKDILVSFTLLDTPPYTGPVEVPLHEPSLERAITRLDSIINSNGLAFRAKYGTKQVILRARPDSLNVQHRSTVEKTISSGPRITGLWLGFIAVGLVVGGIGSFIIFHKLTRK